VDTKTLVVGQDVRMVSGVYCQMGEVVNVTPTGVDVEVGGPGGEIDHFNANGKGCDGNGTYECGPWDLDDAPFEVGTVESEQARDWRERTKS
jgi:hypothetical protein